MRGGGEREEERVSNHGNPRVKHTEEHVTMVTPGTGPASKRLRHQQGVILPGRLPRETHVHTHVHTHTHSHTQRTHSHVHTHTHAHAHTHAHTHAHAHAHAHTH